MFFRHLWRCCPNSTTCTGKQQCGMVFICAGITVSLHFFPLCQRKPIHQRFIFSSLPMTTTFLPVPSSLSVAKQQHTSLVRHRAKKETLWARMQFSGLPFASPAQEGAMYMTWGQSHPQKILPILSSDSTDSNQASEAGLCTGQVHGITHWIKIYTIRSGTQR